MFNYEMETLPREDLEALQLRRLQNLCHRLYANVPFYRKKFDEMKISPADIRCMADLKRLPFTEKQDLRNHYPYGMLAVPKDTIVRIHASSGTTGKASVIGYTRRDLDNWSELVARCLGCGRVGPKDVLHNAYGYGLFTGGLGLHYGGERLGLTVVPVSGGGTKRQIQLLKDFGATVVSATPSYMLHLYEAAEEMGVNIRELPLRVGIFGAEPWTEEMRADIERKMGIDALNIYGLSEIMGPGVSQECIEAKHGMHIFEDHFLPEIIDPTTGEQLPAGEEGELVLTTLTKEGVPLLRYRTRDICSLDYTPCACGRTHVRMSRITGRSDDMLIIRGVNVYPSQIEALLLEADGLTPHYLLVVRRKDNLDTLEVQVEVSDNMFSDEIKELQRKEMMLQKSIKDFLGVSAKVRLVEPQTIKRSEGKATRILDLRNEE